MRRLARIAAILVAIPLVLTVAYSVLNPVSTLMLGRWVTGQSVTRDWVALDEISPHLVRAVVVSEDARFCMHWGVDWVQMSSVLERFLAGEETRGASTISMQTAKNLFLWPGRSYVRKAVEIPLALWLDLVLSKDRVLEIYLNVAEWSPGVFGAEAAAQHYFGRPAADIGPRQGALLAATLPDPDGRNAARPSPGVQRIAAGVQREVERSGWVFDCLDAPIRS
ncbi:monofunctional biosynthetic peptidoglycan transglycosylase [Amorphus orientalis]|uniref:Biosynthetic peptidoglycan transglycosylase n=1 Tax=Amorphus orientalis TaxID=649198 RepID=A0AAE3VN90_9HYPH|nr:monofunctional biosynthetic peptidoglycan transglycosylase [Amorphus orientalis]MDQ0315151.1 monofunctional biosynthetic peptidoglycan transglycosylase [Amorphus orientalis]